MSNRRTELEAAYRATDYCVAFPDTPFTLRINEPSPAVDALLEQYAAEHWAYLTACNPDSRQLKGDENDRRQSELEQRLSDAGYVYFPGAGVGATGDWPPEPSFLVLGISEADAADLGRMFGQRAVVVGQRGAAPRLLWLS
jgi:hypothetical protein